MLVSIVNSLKDPSYLFDDIYHWIDELILFAEKNTDLHFIFRSHPDEIRSDKKIYEKTSDYILQYSENNKNISIIDAEITTTSYELINIIIFIVIYPLILLFLLFVIMKQRKQIKSYK